MSNCSLPLSCSLALQASRQPDAVALMAGELFWSYRTLDQRVQLMACGLRKNGLNTGDVLVVAGCNSPMLVVLILACFRAGVIVLPVNPAFPEDDIRKLYDLVGGTGFWSDDPALGDDLETVRLPVDLRRVCGVDVPLEWDEQRICNLILTSGSSGFPKVAAFNFTNHRASAEGSQRAIPLTPHDGWLMSLPLYHVSGLATLLRCILAGARVIFPDNRSELARTLCRRQVSHVSMVNSQLYRLLRKDDFSFKHTAVRTLLIDGGYVSAELARECQEQGVEILTTYGMTEMGSQICTGLPDFVEGGAVTSGQALPGTEVNIDESDNVFVRGAALFQGYWQQGRLNRPVDGLGWFATGDKGQWVEASGRRLIQITGRTDCQFISGGENIQPEAIELVLLTLDNVAQAIVVPVVDSEYGERPAAFINCKKTDFSPDTWRQTLRQRLPGFMVPDYFFSWPEQHINRGLKVNRQDLTRLAGQMIADHADGKNVSV